MSEVVLMCSLKFWWLTLSEHLLQFLWVWRCFHSVSGPPPTSGGVEGQVMVASYHNLDSTVQYGNFLYGKVALSIGSIGNNITLWGYFFCLPSHLANC